MYEYSCYYLSSKSENLSCVLMKPGIVKKARLLIMLLDNTSVIWEKLKMVLYLLIAIEADADSIYSALKAICCGVL